jgi:cytoskeleton protein RodZ
VSVNHDFESASVAAPTAVPPSLGLLLRKAREARGLSVTDVVQTLKFSSRQIEAIESDDVEALPGSVFVRGLIRSYARLLKLDPEPLLDVLDASAPASAPDVRPPENMGNAMPRGGVRQIPPLVALSILILIAATVMAAWHYLGGGSLSSRTATQETIAPAVTKNVELAKADTLSRPVAIETTKVVPPAGKPVSQPPEAAPDGRRLSFDFRGESWIEVKDAGGQIILTGQFASGTQSVAGRAPYEVIIGNATNVTLQYEGRPVDLKPYTRAEVARLNLQ